jgi:type II secretory pathway component PulF
MPVFTYEATDKNGLTRSGEQTAPNKAGVIEHLEREGWTPIAVNEKYGQGGEERGKGLQFALFESVSVVDRMMMARNMSAMIKAGISLMEALDILIADASKGIVKTIFVSAKTNLQNGRPLSATFEQYKKYFPPVFIGMFRVGEASGQLDRILDELAKFMAREYGLTRKVRSALAYPVILIVASLAVVTLLVAFILPRLAKTFAQTGAELPLITRVLVAAGEAIAYSFVLDVVIVAGLVWFFTFFRKTPMGQRFFLSILMHTPVARDLVKKVALVRFARTLGNLVSSGVSILEALDLAADSVGNSYYREAILAAKDQIKSGVPIAQTFEQHGNLFPKLFVNMLVVGEKTGTLDNILKTLADFYEEEVDDALKNLITVLEPLLLLFMGVMIGTIAISILMPIYQLVGKFV